jgi:hypothetical protein
VQALRQSQLPPHQENVQQLRIRQKQQTPFLRLEKCQKTVNGAGSQWPVAISLQLPNLDNFPNSFK